MPACIGQRLLHDAGEMDGCLGGQLPGPVGGNPQSGADRVATLVFAQAPAEPGHEFHRFRRLAAEIEEQPSDVAQHIACALLIAVQLTDHGLTAVLDGLEVLHLHDHRGQRLSDLVVKFARQFSTQQTVPVRFDGLSRRERKCSSQPQWPLSHPISPYVVTIRPASSPKTPGCGVLRPRRGR